VKINWSRITAISYVVMILLLIGTCAAYVAAGQDKNIRNAGLALTYIDIAIVFLSVLGDVVDDKVSKRR